MSKIHKFLIAVMWLFAGLMVADAARAERIKDLASIAGVRNNQLVGYGLVVGLDGTGDQTTQTPFTVQSIINMLSQHGRQSAAGPVAATQERRGGDGDGDAAALRPCRPADRRHGLVDRQRQVPEAAARW